MLKKVLLASAAAGLLSACASKWDVDDARSLPVAGGAFNHALHAEYIELAAAERAESDWRDTAYFIAKARAAATGRTVLPTELTERDLDDRFLPDGRMLRDALMERLDIGREGLPKAAAQAQSGFDCWAQEAEEGHQPDDIAACREDYDLAMRALDMVLAQPAPAAAPKMEAQPAPKVEAQPAPMAAVPTEYTVYFPAGTRLNADARDTLRAVAEGYAKAQPKTVVIAGHTDTVGRDNANILLSQKRAEAIANALAALGVATEVMALEAYGEEQPKLATGQNVDELQNRRVEITFENDAR